MKRILNLYGGLSTHFYEVDTKHEITIIEPRKTVCNYLRSINPNFIIICADPHEFLILNHHNYDCIFISYPNIEKSKKSYLDLKVFQEILFLQSYSKKKQNWIVTCKIGKRLIDELFIYEGFKVWSNMMINKPVLLEESQIYLMDGNFRGSKSLLKHSISPVFGSYLFSNLIGEKPKVNMTQIDIFEVISEKNGK